MVVLKVKFEGLVHGRLFLSTGWVGTLYNHELVLIYIIWNTRHQSPSKRGIHNLGIYIYICFLTAFVIMPVEKKKHDTMISSSSNSSSNSVLIPFYYS